MAFAEENGYWNYRIVSAYDEKTNERYCQIRSVHYTPDRKIEQWSVHGVAPQGETPEELRVDFDLMLKAFECATLEESDLLNKEKRKELR